MRVGWLIDESEIIGGAELTAREFADTAPKGVTIVPCPAGGVVEDCDVYVVHNSVSYSATATIPVIERRPVVRYCHDVIPHGDPDLKAWLITNARLLFCSPVQQQHMRLPGDLCPPAVPLARFRGEAGLHEKPDESTVWLGHMLNAGKGVHLAVEWADRNGRVDFYGEGPYAPQPSENVRVLDPVPYEDIPVLLARYDRFLFLPSAVEPFGRAAVEAWAAGCKLTLNGLVGAGWWIEHRPDELDQASGTFWNTVLACA